MLRVALKTEIEFAHARFILVYKSISKGLTKIYTEAMLTDDLNEIERLHSKFFGYIKKSKKSKDKWT